MSSIENYNPDFFTPSSLEDAKRIVLGYGITESPHKWEVETKWNMSLFRENEFLSSSSIVLDWGTGIGRLAKAMIETFGCTVVGVDINETMREYATSYVNHRNFSTMSVEELKISNLKFTNVTASWVLQHSIDVDADVRTILNHLDHNGNFFIFEGKYRCIPILVDEKPVWRNSSETNFNLINKSFTLLKHGVFPPHFDVPENTNSWWGFFKNNRRKI